MEDFKECRDHVRNWMVESGYGYASVHPFDLLCKSLAAYFADTGVPYTPEAAEKWAILQDESPSRVRIASQNLGLARLRDVYVYGEISPFHYGRIHGTIGMGFEGELEDYLREFRQRNHAERSVSPVESACRRFALAMEAAQGAQCLRDVSCMALPAYVDLVKDGVSEKWVALQISRVCSWLRYEAELGCCHDSLWIFLNKLKSFPDCAAALDIPQGYTILRAGTSVEYPSADVVRIKTHVLLDALEKAGYKATLLGTTRWALELFYVFLDANSSFQNVRK